MAELIETLYRDLARTATDRMPRVTELLDTEGWRSLHRRRGGDSMHRRSVDRQHGPARSRRRNSMPSATARAVIAEQRSQRFQLFHTPPGDARSPRRQARTDDPRIDARLAGAPARRAARRKRTSPRARLPSDRGRDGLVPDAPATPRARRGSRFWRPASFTPAAAADLSVTVRFPAGTLQVPRRRRCRPGDAHAAHRQRFDAVPNPAADLPLEDGLLDLEPPAFRLAAAGHRRRGAEGDELRALAMRRATTWRRASTPVTRQEDEVGAPRCARPD